jgi:hypothetical protein
MINSELMEKFVKKSLANLEGEWVIIGGTVLLLLGIDERITMDIDIVPIDLEETNSQNLKLFEIAESLNLPVETINHAGEYFLSKIDDFKDHLVLIGESKRCKIFRPDTFLFLKLKLARMTETDLLDCISFSKFSRKETNPYQKETEKLLRDYLKKATPEKKEKLLKIISLLTT